MSDAVKWGLLVAGAIAVIALIVALPITEILGGDVSGYMADLLDIIGDFLTNARGIINLFLDPFSIRLVSVALGFIILKPFITLSIKLATLVYKWIFK